MKLLITLMLILPTEQPFHTGPQKARIMLATASRQAGLTYHQWNCLDKLITKESNYRPNAKTGSHYGIGQIKHLGKQPLQTQVNRVIKYLFHRYNGNACKAWHLHQQRNWW